LARSLHHHVDGWRSEVDEISGSATRRVDAYSEIQQFVQRHQGFIPKTTWINHVKVVWGLPTRRAPNRARGGRRVVQCPPEKLRPSNRRFGMSA
jgi:hypothetical protein